MNKTSSRPDLLQDIIERIEAARQGLIQTVEPFTLRELNYKPGGTAVTIRQLLNHLWATEAWMIERVARALKGELELSKEEADGILTRVFHFLNACESRNVIS